MALLSMLELPGSPTEQASAATITYYWDPTAELGAGESVSSPTCTVTAYDPAYPDDTNDVTATSVAPGSPFVGVGSYGGLVGVTVQGLTAGYEYRVLLGCTASAGHVPVRFFRVRCLV